MATLGVKLSSFAYFIFLALLYLEVHFIPNPDYPVAVSAITHGHPIAANGVMD
ncbi:MAG TPA: hypothetical protein VLO13_05320 [Halomonas sp.]|nr:hypothetical protein [Halomonas sp.]